ncbi:hypothetical protein NLX78_22750 [Paenibacillus sp. Lou8.1]|uniref:hypothetical protein n=1 Tax=Paenibacillus sp. Lou8.1 TaxID=2962041 RepID=UPI0020B6B8E5|nr:hypothetical protein [Paenibacillus sp. Lou8.1]MCP3810043.1 hypothetical protein [Paenibacillus sp. Lou8.1]
MSVKDMTDQQINRWLAEYMGYTISEYKDKWGWLMCPNGDNVHESLFPLDELWGFVPDYCNNPAASLEVQAAAIELDRVAYVNNLYEACYEFKRVKDSVWDEINIAFLLNASPCQRAEAAYLTLSSQD